MGFLGIPKKGMPQANIQMRTLREHVERGSMWDLAIGYGLVDPKRQGWHTHQLSLSRCFWDPWGLLGIPRDSHEFLGIPRDPKNGSM